MPHYTVNDEVVPGHFLVKFLGKGGFGEVWKATGPGGVEVAIKMINLTSDQGFKEFRALRMLRKLRHPNLVPLSGFWLKDEEGRLIDDSASENSLSLQRTAAEMVIAMGLGEKSLLDRLKECKKAGIQGIPQTELLDYLEQSARAIDFLNEPVHDLGRGPVGIQHCDIKPGNILIVGNAIQVCDFGLARVLGDQARSTTVASFTPAYTAPEVIEGKPCRQTDQYSLAITYVELRTGSLPFVADNPSKAMKIHLSGQLDFSKLPKNEGKVMRRATALNPVERFPTTLAMVQALRDVVNEGVPKASKSSGDISLDGVQPGQELVPGYKLVRLIGRGGYGEVWEAVAPGGKHCALKIIRSLDVSANTQELRTLELMKSLEHVHLMEVQAYWLLNSQGDLLSDDDGSATTANMLVILTQLAVKNLAQRLKECHKSGQRGIPPQELILYMRQSADAVDHLNSPVHILGDKPVSIQHRDIKPENILLTRNNLVKISDFGLAKIVEGASATIHSQSRGLTIAYAAPEMFKGTVTRWTDQYSLAISYYKLRTGTLPFDSNQPPFTMMLVHTEGRLDFSLATPPEQEVLLRATSVVPEDRYDSCTAMVLALEAALSAGDSPTVPRQSLPSQGLLHLSAPSPQKSERTRPIPPMPGVPSGGTPGSGSTSSQQQSPAQPPSSRPSTQQPADASPAPAVSQSVTSPQAPSGPSVAPIESPASVPPPAQRTAQASVRPPSAPPPRSAGPPVPIAPPVSRDPTEPLRFVPDELNSGEPGSGPDAAVTPPPDKTDGDAIIQTLRPGGGERKKSRTDPQVVVPEQPSDHPSAKPAWQAQGSAVAAPPAEHSSGPRHAWQEQAVGLAQSTTERITHVSGDWLPLDVDEHAPLKTRKSGKPPEYRPRDNKKLKYILTGVFVGVAVTVTLIIMAILPPRKSLSAVAAELVQAGEYSAALDLIDECDAGQDEKVTVVKDVVEKPLLQWCKENVEKQPGEIRTLVTRLEKYVPDNPDIARLRTEAASLVPQVIAREVDTLLEQNSETGYSQALGLVEQRWDDLGEMGPKLKTKVQSSWSRAVEQEVRKLLDEKKKEKLFLAIDRVNERAKELSAAGSKLQDDVLQRGMSLGGALSSESDPDYDSASEVYERLAKEQHQPAKTALANLKATTDGIVKKRDELAGMGQYAEAAKHLETQWKKGAPRLKQQMFDSAFQRASKLHLDGKLDDADKIVKSVASLDSGPSKRWGELASSIRIEQNRNAIVARISNAKDGVSFKAAAKELKGLKDVDLPAGARPQLLGRLEDAWIGWAVKRQTAYERHQSFKELDNELQTERTRTALASNPKPADLTPYITAAHAALARGDVAEGEKKLNDAKIAAGGDPALLKRINELLALVKQGKEFADSNTTSAKLDAFSDAIAKVTEKTDRDGLEALLDALRSRRIRQAIATMPDKQDADGQPWKSWFAECEKVKNPDAWVVACRMECLAEQARRTGVVSEKQKETAKIALRDAVVAADAKGYVEYVRRLSEWSFGDNGRMAADNVRTSMAGLPIPEILKSSPYRLETLCHILVGNLGELKKNATLGQPFGSPADAETAFGWLAVAETLMPEKVSAEVRQRVLANLALAAWSKPAEHERAGRAAEAIVSSKNLENLSNVDLYQLHVIYAATRGKTAEGRSQAVAGYLAAIDAVHAVLKEKPDEKALKEAADSLLAPCLANRGADLLAPDSDAPQKEQAAMLLSRAARLLAANPKMWSAVYPEEDKPRKLVVDLYQAAFDLAKKPELRVHLSGARALLEKKPDYDKLAEEARGVIDSYKDYSGGYALEGYALLLKSRGKSDINEKTKLLRDARDRFETAFPLAEAELKKKERDLDDSDLCNLCVQWSATCLELGNYVVNKPKEREELILAAVDKADKARQFNPKSQDAWDALAYAHEDVASVLNQKDKYQTAIDAFNKAIDLSYRTAGMRPWLGRARCQVKWTESAKDGKLLGTAEEDLDKVVERVPASVEAAEAWFWRARIAQFRRSRPGINGQQKTVHLQRAQSCYGEAAKVAKDAKADTWLETALREHTFLLFGEVVARGDTTRTDLVKQTEAQAQELATFSKAQGHFVLGFLHYLRSEFAQSADEYKKGMESPRSQDQGTLHRLYTERAKVLLYTGKVPEAVADARVGQKMVDKIGMDFLSGEEIALLKFDRANANGTLGEALSKQANVTTDADDRKKIRTQAVAVLRAALTEDVDPPTRWLWAYKFAEIQQLLGNLSDSEKTEGWRYIQEASLKVPKTDGYKGFRDEIETIYKWYDKNKP